LCTVPVAEVFDTLIYHTFSPGTREAYSGPQMPQMRGRARLQSYTLLAALAVGLTSASMSPAIHPSFSAVLRSRSLERFEPKVASDTPFLPSHLCTRMCISTGGETPGDGYLDRSSSRPAGCRGCQLHVILCGCARVSLRSLRCSRTHRGCATSPTCRELDWTLCCGWRLQTWGSRRYPHARSNDVIENMIYERGFDTGRAPRFTPGSAWCLRQAYQESSRTTT
jgi:hypothetical protein